MADKKSIELEEDSSVVLAEKSEPPKKLLFEETDKKLKQFALHHNAVLLGLIASPAGERLSPVHYASPYLGLVEEHMVDWFLDIISSSKPKLKKLFLLLNSSGGSLLSSYKIAKALRSTFEEIVVFVPNMAQSGATLVSLAGNKIVMGAMSSLSPIDPQVIDGHQRFSVLAPLRALDRWRKVFSKLTVGEAPYPYKALVDQLNPLLIEDCTSTANAAQKYAEEILLGAGYGQKEAEKIAYKLVWGMPIHEDHVGIKEAQHIGLKVESRIKCEKMWDTMRIWMYRYLFTPSATHRLPYVIPAKTNKMPNKNRKKQKVGK